MYETLYTDTALKQLAKLPRNWRERVIEKIRSVAADPHRPIPNARAMRGSTLYRLRVGDWRVVYDIDDGIRVLTVVKVASRGGVYDD